MATEATHTSEVVPPRVTGSVLDELMTARQLASVLQMRVSTVEDYARRGLIPSLKLGRHRRFVRTDVEAVITSLMQERTFTLRAPRPAGRTPLAACRTDRLTGMSARTHR